LDGQGKHDLAAQPIKRLKRLGVDNACVVQRRAGRRFDSVRQDSLDNRCGAFSAFDYRASFLK
jgi:hypothetical protein